MNADRSYVTLTAVLLTVVGAAHLARALLGWPVSIAGYDVPLAVSWLAGPVTLAFGAWGIAQLRRG